MVIFVIVGVGRLDREVKRFGMHVESSIN